MRCAALIDATIPIHPLLNTFMGYTKRYWAAGLACIAAAFLYAPPLLRWADIHYLHETARDLKGRWINHEDWSGTPSLSSQLDYGWLPEARWIAHALGAAGEQQENTLAAFETSRGRGFHVFEVDVWRDEAGQLRCHHGPAKPPTLRPGDCTWGGLIETARPSHAWLVLDIKTEFEPTARALLQALPRSEDARRVIFQLYKPEHVALFAGWSKAYPLPGPIVTAYSAYRSLDHLALHTQRSGIRALAVPLERRAALERLPVGLGLFVHPINNCTDAQRAAPASGLYLNSATALVLHRRCEPF